MQPPLRRLAPLPIINAGPGAGFLLDALKRPSAAVAPLEVIMPLLTPFPFSNPSSLLQGSAV